MYSYAGPGRVFFVGSVSLCYKSPYGITYLTFVEMQFISKSRVVDKQKGEKRGERFYPARGRGIATTARAAARSEPGRCKPGKATDIA